jgi:hypothetical protein
MKHGKNKFVTTGKVIPVNIGGDFIDFRSNVELGMETM